jgi:hypothetical protein
MKKLIHRKRFSSSKISTGLVKIYFTSAQWLVNNGRVLLVFLISVREERKGRFIIQQRTTKFGYCRFQTNCIGLIGLNVMNFTGNINNCHIVKATTT